MIAGDGSMLSTDYVRKVYDVWSNFYDMFFKKIVHPRISTAIGALNIMPGERILEVGVGTGLALPLYPSHCKVIGIDLSMDMLKKAKERIQNLDIKNSFLLQMDAHNLAFPDNSFDYVMAAFVVTVVPDPVRVIKEMKRVCKKDGKIIIINHFQSENRIFAKIEEMVSPICCRIGWRSDLALEDLVKATDLQIISEYRKNRFDLWRIVLAYNNK